jgi:hypothetical protein
MPGRESASRKREAVISALLGGATYAQAAERAKVSERTVRSWARDPSFKVQFREARLAVVERTITAVQSISLTAVATLARAMNCGKPATEVAAADKILQRGVEGIELFDLIGRVEALEERLALQGAGHENRNAFPNGTASNGQHPGR